MNTAAWIQGPKTKLEKLKNQTCHHYVKDSTEFIIFEHLLRWKVEFPDFFSNMPGNKFEAKSTKRIASGIPRKKYPKFCQASKGFIDFLENQERLNLNDIKADHPELAPF